MDTYFVTRTVQETNDTVTAYFADKSGRHPDFLPGQYLTIKFSDLEPFSGKAYSISSTPSDKEMSVTVKAIGNYSRRICNLQVGDKITASKPYGSLFDNSNNQPIVCFAGGIGISPIWSIIKYSIQQYPSRNIILNYSCKILEDFVFKKQIDNLASHNKTLKVNYFVTRQNIRPKTNYHSGRIDVLKIINDFPKSSQIIICGSADFVSGIYKQLIDYGIPDESISTETFFGAY